MNHNVSIWYAGYLTPPPVKGSFGSQRVVTHRWATSALDSEAPHSLQALMVHLSGFIRGMSILQTMVVCVSKELWLLPNVFVYFSIISQHQRVENLNPHFSPYPQPSYEQATSSLYFRVFIGKRQYELQVYRTASINKLIYVCWIAWYIVII